MAASSCLDSNGIKRVRSSFRYVQQQRNDRRHRWRHTAARRVGRRRWRPRRRRWRCRPRAAEHAYRPARLAPGTSYRSAICPISSSLPARTPSRPTLAPPTPLWRECDGRPAAVLAQKNALPKGRLYPRTRVWRVCTYALDVVATTSFIDVQGPRGVDTHNTYEHVRVGPPKIFISVAFVLIKNIYRVQSYIRL